MGTITLFDWLDSATSEAMVALENITEYQSGAKVDFNGELGKVRYSQKFVLILK